MIKRWLLGCAACAALWPLAHADGRFWAAGPGAPPPLGVAPPPLSGGYGAQAAPYGVRPYGERPYGERPYGERPYGEQPYGEQPYGQQPYARWGREDGRDAWRGRWQQGWRGARAGYGFGADGPRRRGDAGRWRGEDRYRR